MSRSGPNLARRSDLKAALKRTKPDDVLTLDACAVLWGVVKTRFVNVRNDIEATIGWPQARPGPRNSFLYPAGEAIEKMLAYEMRHDELANERQQRIDKILGRTRRVGSKSASDGYAMPVNEMATIHRLATEIEVRERNQRLYIPAAEVSATCGEVFAIFSEFCSDLDNRCDPNGELPAETRKRIRALGADLQLRIHGEMKDLLEADANPGSTQLAGSRGAARSARRASPRR